LAKKNGKLYSRKASATAATYELETESLLGGNNRRRVVLDLDLGTMRLVVIIYRRVVVVIYRRVIVVIWRRAGIRYLDRRRVVVVIYRRIVVVIWRAGMVRMIHHGRHLELRTGIRRTVDGGTADGHGHDRRRRRMRDRGRRVVVATGRCRTGIGGGGHVVAGCRGGDDRRHFWKRYAISGEWVDGDVVSSWDFINFLFRCFVFLSFHFLLIYFLEIHAFIWNWRYSCQVLA